MKANRSRQGLGLVEMAVAAALWSVLLGCLYLAQGAVAGTGRRCEDLATAIDGAHAAMERIRQDLALAQGGDTAVTEDGSLIIRAAGTAPSEVVYESRGDRIEREGPGKGWRSRAGVEAAFVKQGPAVRVTVCSSAAGRPVTLETSFIDEAAARRAQFPEWQARPLD